MARKTKEEAQATRDALLDAAERVFREKGVSRSRLDDVAVAAGVTRGALYWHFRNKVDLLIAMVDRVTVPIYDEMGRLANSDLEDPLAAWRSHLTESIDTIVKDTHVQNVLDILINRCELNDEITRLAELEQARYCGFVSRSREIIGKAQRAGQLSESADLDMLTLTMHGMINGLIRLWLRMSDTFDLTAAVISGFDGLLDSARTDLPS